MTRPFLALLCMLIVAGCGSQTTWQERQTTHIVRKGETLSAIAWRYRKSTADLARWNRLGDGSLIYPGQAIRLTGPPAARRQPDRTSRRSSPPRSPLPDIPTEPSPDWRFPTAGRISVEFGEKPGQGTGVLIDGDAGQAVYAAAAGRVVYAGSGLIGYGKLIILKHNNTYLSAYGYNATLLVKEGDEIAKGQKLRRWEKGRNANLGCISRFARTASR